MQDGKNRQAKKGRSIRQWTILSCVAMTVGSAGCNTFIQETADLMEGGPQRRVEEAVRRQQAAVEEQRGLRQNQRELEQQLTREERDMREMRGRLQMQTAKITEARENNRLSAAQEERLKRRIADLDSEIQVLEFKIQADRLSAGSAEDTSRLRQKLETLRAEEKRIEEEIRALEN